MSMSKLECAFIAVVMMIAGYASMNFIAGFARTPASVGLPPQRHLAAQEKAFDLSSVRSASRFGVTRVADGEYAVDVASFDSEWATPCDPRRWARFEPSCKDGECDGFTLVALPQDSSYAALGFRSGDLIKAINGIPLNGADSALAAYDLLQRANYWEVEFERHGVTVRHRYWRR